MHVLYASDHGVDRYIVHALREIGHVVDVCDDLADAAVVAAGQDHELTVLDLAQPSAALVRRFAVAAPAALHLVLTEGEGGAAAQLLRAGADAVLSRPLEIAEVQERLRALQRLSERARVSPQVGRWLADLRSERVLRIDGRELQLSPRELQLLIYFMRRPGEVVDLERLSQNIWGEEREPSPERVRAAVARLRQRLEAAFGRPFLHTVRGHGYVFRAEA